MKSEELIFGFRKVPFLFRKVLKGVSIFVEYKGVGRESP
jgi:hypothetical protein